MNKVIFENRLDAAHKLIENLKIYENDKNIIVLGLPRGGVVLAYEIAKYLKASLDVLISRKIRFPGNPELAIGAKTEIDNEYFNEDMIKSYNLSKDSIKKSIEKTDEEINYRKALYRKSDYQLNLKDKLVFLVDDGIATGATMFAAIDAVKKLNAKKIIVVSPVIPEDTLEKLKEKVNDLVYINSPKFFLGVSQAYKEFAQVSDYEVVSLLEKARKA